ncbi:MAG: hypothetical protein SF097_05130 [Acidobacteriota bacterium]|nr:hypothetical protein [Acidobacteriota bacterium]
MLSHENSFSLRFKLAMTAFAAVVAVTAALSVAHAIRTRSGATAATTPAQVVATLPPFGFVPAGSPVRLVNLSADVFAAGKQSTQFVTTLRGRVVTVGNDKFDSLNLMVFEFDGSAMLRRVDGFVVSLDLSSVKPADLTLPLGRKVLPTSRLVLAVERANGDAKGWEMNVADLARGSAAVAAERTPPGLNAREGNAVRHDSGAALCSNGFRRAMALAQLGDKASVTSFTCDQQEGSFTFTFQPKQIL